MRPGLLAKEAANSLLVVILVGVAKLGEGLILVWMVDGIVQRRIADARNKILLVTVTNPDKRPKKTKMTVQSQNAGYIPVGYTIQAR